MKKLEELTSEQLDNISMDDLQVYIRKYKKQENPINLLKYQRAYTKKLMHIIPDDYQDWIKKLQEGWN